jgi:hypothetical protein
MNYEPPLHRELVVSFKCGELSPHFEFSARIIGKYEE